MQLKEGAAPKYFRSRSVPFAIREAVGGKLDRLEATGILEKIFHTDWAAPIVALPKKDGKFRICVDYKVTINTVLNIDQHPPPKLEELFATLVGSTKIYIRSIPGLHSIMLDDTSSQYVSINVHKGLHKYTLSQGDELPLQMNSS